MADDLPDDLLPPGEARLLLPRVPDVRTLYRWVRSGRLSAWKVGGRWLVSAAEVRALVRPRPALATTAANVAGPAPAPGSRAARAAAWRKLRSEGVG